MTTTQILALSFAAAALVLLLLWVLVPNYRAKQRQAVERGDVTRPMIEWDIIWKVIVGLLFVIGIPFGIRYCAAVTG